VAQEFKANAASRVVPADKCPSDAMILDAGPEATKAVIAAFEAIPKDSKARPEAERRP